MKSSRTMLWLLYALAANAQPYPFDMIPGAVASFHAIAQDREGFLWLAGSKLQRFDGSRLVDVNVNGPARDLEAAADGSVWVAAEGGIYRVNGLHAERKLTAKAQYLLIHDEFLYFAESDTNHINRIAMRDIGNTSPARIATGLGKPQMDKSGSLWFACETTLCELKEAATANPTLRQIGADRGLPAEPWAQVRFTQTGDLWAVGANHAYVLRSRSTRFVHGDARLANIFRIYLTQTRKGQEVWLLGANGVYRERDGGGQPVFYRHPALPIDMGGFGIFSDREDNLWLSHTKGGLARWIGGGTIESWNATSGLPQAIQIAEGADGSIFAGNQQGLFRLRAGELRWTEIPGTRKLGAILQVKPAPPGHILFATGTLNTFEFDLKTDQWQPAQLRTLTAGFPARDITLVPGPGATVGPKTNTYWPTIDVGYPHRMDMIEGKTDAQGRSWFVTRSGLWLRSPQAVWRQFTKADGMLESSVQAIQLAQDDSVWIGYDNPLGYSRLTLAADAKPQWTHFPSPNQTASESTLSLGFDTKGRLWRGTGAGVVVTNGESRDGVRLTTRDGLPTNETNLLGFFRAKDGSIWVSTNEGAVHFLNPTKEPLEGKPISTAVASIDSGKAHLAVLSFSEAHKVRLEYRVVPGQESWTLAPADHTANLSALRPGDYRLEARAQSSYWFRPANTAVLDFSVPGIRMWQWITTTASTLAALAGLVVYRKRRNQQAYQRHKRQFLDDAAKQQPDPTATAPPQKQLAAGTLLKDKYRIETLIARGGFSDVYLASVVQSGDRVAIKRLRGNSDAVDPSWMRRRLAQEVAAVCMIKHRGVLPVTDSWIEDNGNASLVLPFVEGPTLRKFVEARGRIDVGTATGILQEVATIIAAAHAKGVIHCDLKPENIMLTGPELRPIVIDFGTSALHLQAAALSEYTKPAGTVQYMAPEQLLGRYSPATDVYAFALLALELLAGVRYIDLQVPFDAGWEEHLITALITRHGLALGTAKLFARALQFDPLKREQSIEPWASELFAMYPPKDENGNT